MRKITFIFLSFFFLSYAAAQTSKKGFKLLEKLEYEKAKSAFDEVLSADQQNPAANFGLALVHSDENSPYYNLIQAWHYCSVLQPVVEKLLQEDLEIIGEYFMNTEKRPSTRPVK